MIDKSNNLTEFLISVADAIRERKNYESYQKINPQDFSEEIKTISRSSIDVSFEAIRSISEVTQPRRNTVYLLYDIEDHIPETLPDANDLKKLKLNFVNEFDYRKGNYYSNNSVTLFSFIFNEINWNSFNLKWLDSESVTFDFISALTNLVSVTNLNGRQQFCRVAVYDSSWHIVNMRELGYGFMEDLYFHTYLTADPIQEDLTQQLNLRDVIYLTPEGENTYKDDLTLSYYLYTLYTGNIINDLKAVDDLSNYEVNPNNF